MAKSGATPRLLSVVSRTGVQPLCTLPVRGLTAGVRIFSGNQDRANFDRGIGGFHQSHVISKCNRVSVWIPLRRVSVILPGTKVLVSNLPIFEVISPGDVRVTHPVGGLLRRAAAIVRRVVDFSRRGQGNAGKGIETCGPGPGIVTGGVGGPMVFIRQTAARETQRLH